MDDGYVVTPAGKGIHLNLAELWRYRRVVYFLAWRDVKVKYKQTFVGIGWSLLNPLLTILLFSIVFGLIVRVPSGDIPYPVFVYAGFLPWNAVSRVVAMSGTSLVTSASLLTKVYFPRMAIPLASMVMPTLDTLISFPLLMLMMLLYGITPSWQIVTLPLILLLGLAAAVGASLWISALYVRFRDVGQLIPFLLQIWMYASPVVYSTNLVPPDWRWLYALNPMVPVLEGFRWGLFGSPLPLTGPQMLEGVVTTGLLLLTGLLYFRRAEDAFADVV